MAPRNLINLESVSKSFGERPLLDNVSTGHDVSGLDEVVSGRPVRASG